jgi:DNA topoisomerase I
MSSKDFRTWHSTVTAAEELAAAGPQPTKTARKKAMSRAMKEVAELLGNAPTVARASYVDPPVIERYEHGKVADVDPKASREDNEDYILELLGQE